jgi:hypothetical protein
MGRLSGDEKCSMPECERPAVHGTSTVVYSCRLHHELDEPELVRQRAAERERPVVSKSLRLRKRGQ